MSIKTKLENLGMHFNHSYNSLYFSAKSDKLFIKPPKSDDIVPYSFRHLASVGDTDRPLTIRDYRKVLNHLREFADNGELFIGNNPNETKPLGRYEI